MGMTFSAQNDFIAIKRQSQGWLVGQCIADVRRSRGVTVEEAAGRAGMQVSESLAIEAGRAPEDQKQLRPMAEALGLARDKFDMIAIVYQDAWE